MDDDEETTILGDLEDAAGLAWDGLGAVASAGVHVASGAASVVEAAGDNIAAAGDQLSGDHAARDEREAERAANMSDMREENSQARQDFQNAADDLY